MKSLTTFSTSGIAHVLVASPQHDLDLSIKIVWQNMRQATAVLTWVGLMLVLWSCFTLMLPWFDSRLFQGVSVWVKPWKFQLSVGVYLLSLAYFMTFLPAAQKLTKATRYVVWVATLGGLFEVIYITLQGAQGLASHYNLSSVWASWMYTLMGIGAVALVSTALVLGVQVLRYSQAHLSDAMRHAVAWGLILTFVLGAFTGGYLGEKVTTGHWVNTACNSVCSDANSLPFFNWSRNGGDLRVAHFFGIHAMHFVPLFVLLLQLKRTWMAQGLAAGFGALCIWTFVQAVQGRPFIA